MIESYVLLGTLGVHSLEDMKQKKITVTFTLFSGIFGIFLHLVFQSRSIYEMLLGMLSGVFVLCLGHLTKGAVGTGDGIVFMLTGLYLGFMKNLMLMFLSFLLAGIFGLLLLLSGRCKKTKRIPFIPFLFLGYVCMMIV